MDTQLLLTIAATGLSAAVVYYHIKAFTFWSSRGIKGPRPWPILGTNIYLLFWRRTDLDVKWRNKYGKVYGIYNGYKPALRISDNQLIKHVFIKEFKYFTDRNNTIIYGHYAKRFLLWSSGEHWSNQRALITPMFTSLRLKTMFNNMSSCTDRFISEIQTRVKSSETSSDIDKKPLKSATFSKSILMALTLDVIARSFFGLKLDTYRDESSEFFKRAFAFATFDVFYFFFWLLIPTFLKKKYEIDITRYYKYEYFDKLTQSNIKERRSIGGLPPKGQGNDFVQMLLDAKISDTTAMEKVHSKEDDLEAHYNDNICHEELDQVQKKLLEKVKFRKFDDLEIRAHSTFFFLAGFETTSSSLAMCLFELAHQQDAQNEVYEELVAAAAAAGGSLSGESGYLTLQSLMKLDAFVSETLRLYSPLIEQNRMVTDPNGVILPTEPPIKLPFQTPIAVPVFAMQRDSDYWKDPLKFDMTRFYPENRDKIQSCSYMPFGVGPRNCVGLRFALLEVKLALTCLLLKYKVLPGPKTRVYPPKFKQHFIFVQLAHNDFKLEAR